MRGHVRQDGWHGVYDSVFEEEAILCAELDLDEIARGEYDFVVAGHYARPDVFQLSVNERPLKPVVPGA